MAQSIPASRVCVICGLAIPPGYRKVCSPECRAEYYRRHGRARHNVPRATSCLSCGRPIGKGRRFSCSAPCQRLQERTREAERRRLPRVQEAERLGAERRRRERGMRPRVVWQPVPSSLYGPDLARVVVVGGFGIGVHVSDGHLVVSTRDEEPLRLPRVSPLCRLVIVGSSGSVSLLALWWLREVGASVVIVEATGRLLTVTAPDGRDDARLRRAQAMAPWTPASLVLARELNLRKLDGYLDVLAGRPVSPAISQAAETLAAARSRLAGAQSIAEVRAIEAESGLAYHRALADVPMRWRGSDPVPEHWRTLGPRRSAVTSSARGATTPGQALRNFLGGLAAAEIAVACRTMGLDPGVGIGLHDDVKGRQSLIWEVMEAVRPGATSTSCRRGRCACAPIGRSCARRPRRALGRWLPR